MKDLILIFALFGIFGMANAQKIGSDPETEESGDKNEQEEAAVAYLREVQSPITPNAVREYQLMAVKYDVAQSDLFDGRDALFLVIFRTRKGAIEASYDWTGEVVQSIERFRNIALPHKILRSGMRPYSGWRVVGTNYYVYYIENRKTRIIYTIQIADGKKRKKIFLNGEGSLLN